MFCEAFACFGSPYTKALEYAVEAKKISASECHEFGIANKVCSLNDLDDVTFTGITTGSLLIYEADTQKWLGIASTALVTAAEELAAGCTGVDLTLSGDLNVTGDLVYDEQTSRNVNITGVSTFNQGIGTNLNITGVSTAATMHVGSATTWGENLVVTGNARVTGILTAGIAFAGEGAPGAKLANA